MAADDTPKWKAWILSVRPGALYSQVERDKWLAELAAKRTAGKGKGK